MAVMPADRPYYTMAEYMATIFPGRIQKIAVNANLGCPNRDGTIGTGGCIYCNNASFNPAYAHNSRESISRQIEDGVKFFKKRQQPYGYLAYFQSYTNTYAKTEKLIELYEEALAYPGVVGLVVATRPDCLSEALIEYFAKRFGNSAPEGHPYLLVEIGVESTYNETLKKINRGHSYECAKSAIYTLYNIGIAVGVHIILGLPGESRDMMLNHAKRVSELPISTLKLHQLQIIKNTPLATMYEQGVSEVHIFTADEYAHLVADFIRLLPHGIAIDRFVSETPPSMLIAPYWGIKPSKFTEMVETYLLHNV